MSGLYFASDSMPGSFDELYALISEQYEFAVWT